MICLSANKQGADVLIEYLGRTLDPVRTAELERHFEECADCRGLVRVWTALDEWPAPEVSADFDQRLYARIAAEERLPWWKKISWKPAIPLAACATLIAGFFLMRPPETTEQLKAKIEPVNIEQVEQALEDIDLLTPVRPGPAGAM
jgi:hypothetical protein